jgi:serine/threonine protein kinase/tetratricopeptide (TPR) repeat protein
MTPEQWERAKSVANDAFELEPYARGGFVAEVCDGDAEVRREVLRLLSGDASPGLDFLSSPPLRLPALIGHLEAPGQTFAPGEMSAARAERRQVPMNSREPGHRDSAEPKADTMWAAGQQVGNYIILDQLGSGGMGVVYKARDVRLELEVALKALRALSSTRTLDAVFLREARLASSLNHPGIVTIYDIFEHEGTKCIVMEYVAGKPLGALIPPAGMRVADALPLAIQIGAAVAAAHATDVVHRDLKPSNILVREDGRIKVVDFGIATVSREAHSGEITPFGGAMAGTPPYMAPEQVCGERVDRRADIFSFGVILAMMLTGEPPFREESRAALLSAILFKNPEPPSKLRPDLPASLDFLVLRALEKNREHRFASLPEMLALLKQVDASGSSSPQALAAGVSAGTEGSRRPDEPTWVDRPRPLPPLVGQERTSIGVIPFRIFSSDPGDQFLGSGIASEIISALSGVPGIRVASQVASLGLDPEKIEPAGAAMKLKVRYLVTGNLRRAGDRIRLHAELVDAKNGSIAWNQHYDRKMADIFEVQEDLSKAIAGSLGGHLIRTITSTKQHTAVETLDAWGLLRKAYQIWTYQFSVPNLLESIKLLRRAVGLQPDYAAANAYLAHNLMQTAIFNIAKDPKAVLAEALALAERACDIAPEDPDTISCASSVFVNTGRYEQAVLHLKRVLRIAPFDFVAWGFLAYAHAAAGGPSDVADAERILTQLIHDAPDHPSVPYWLMFLTIADLRLAWYDNAIEHGRRAVDMQPAYVFNEVLLGEALMRSGREKEASDAMAMILKYNPRFTMAMFDEVTLTACRSAQTLQQLSGLVRELGVIPAA